MQTYILNIGNELLIGDTINTNASWLGEFFYHHGFDIVEISSIPDQSQCIVQSLERALEMAELVLITGGLGPTHDDITKKTLANFFLCEMYQDKNVLTHVQSLFAKRGIKMHTINQMQADIPDKAEVLFNDLGTAPGLWFKTTTNKVVVSMPGVPYEMKHIVQQRLWPKLQEEFGLTQVIRRRYFRTAGIGESNLSENYLPEMANYLKQNDRISAAYLPSSGEVKLRISSKAETELEALNQSKALEEYIAKQAESFIYSTNRDEELAQAVGHLLAKKGLTIATAESCTGGAIASSITDHAGSSAFFRGSVVAYHNEIKQHVLSVDPQLLEAHGAVSAQVALQMAEGVAKLCGSDIGLSTTGVAGPGVVVSRSPLVQSGLGFGLQLSTLL